MAFNNFYKSTKNIGNRLMIGVSILCLVTGFISRCTPDARKQFTPYDDKQTGSVRLAQVEKICNELPKPEQFFFVAKDTSINSFSISATYRFKTARSFEEISPIFSIWASSNGWRHISSDVRAFKKDKFLITIEEINLPTYNYQIVCSEAD